MSIQAGDLRKLLKIVRQYEVIYGGGISSSDAAIREECEELVASLESELGQGRGGSRRDSRSASATGPAAAAPRGAKPAKAGRASRQAADPLPSLVDARKAPKGDRGPRPLSARNSELADLAGPSAAAQRNGTGAMAAREAEPTAGGARGGKAGKPAASARAADAGTKASKAKGGPAKAAKAEAGAGSRAKLPEPAAKELRASRGAAASPEPLPAARRAGPAPGSAGPSLYSRPVAAAEAAAVRATKALGSSRRDSAAAGEGKKHFAALHLFDAFSKGKLPKYGGFIVTVRFIDDQGYAIIEIIGYENLQDLYPEGDTLVFKSVGCKLYAIVEPSTYLLKSVEPVNRPMEQMVPYRFSELLRITTKRFQNVLVGRKPVFMPSSFSVFKPAGEDLAVLFYDIADVYSNMQDFIIMILRDRLGVPVPDSRKAGEAIARGIREFRLWLEEA